ncbi:phosphatidylglycerol lysyltransferase domain-containing protein [Parvularcula oceani]|uniref:phosphatidylglycerol lysyltransferase domain-containing protein n=1 Tax=Parvularcula oceani TaxID=1247963 RepID=UPI0009E0069D|nr:phosphatidylglycerol lysyltransferase domain-containing protein [Parvularcula oceani]
MKASGGEAVRSLARRRAARIRRWGVPQAVRVRRLAARLGLGRVPPILAGTAMVLAPLGFAALAFASGFVLLWTLTAPVPAERFGEAAGLLPVAAINASHFFSSLTGVLLLLVASSLRRRSRSAWLVTLVLLGIAAGLNLTRGGPWQPSALLLAVGAALFAARGAFYRKGGLGSGLSEPVWLLAAILAFAIFVWLGLIVFRATPYSDDLWWRFVLEGGAPSRFLRAAAGGAIVLTFVMSWRFLAPQAMPEAAAPPDAARLEAALADGDMGHADANLAWLQDKHLLFSESGRSFLQYGVRGRRMVVMGAPYGLWSELPQLLRDARDRADRHGMSLCFYSVGPALLPALIELGLVIQKIGEAAILPLEDFSLEGSHRQPLRQSRRRAQKEGLSFRIAPKEEVPGLLPRLEAISDDWLSRHEGEEKGFSLGRFDPDYLSRFPMALVEGADGPVAFANIWTTAGQRELSADLMRFSEGSPRGVMDYLFTELAFWGQAQGYRLLDLGMAPLSGLEEDRLAPLMSQVGAFAYSRGGRFYGFHGLRIYKEKFAPVWEPLYLAAPTRLGLPFALADVALMTSGGVRGVIGRP